MAAPKPCVYMVDTDIVYLTDPDVMTLVMTSLN